MTRHVRPPRRMPGEVVPEPLPLPFRPKARITPKPEVLPPCPGPASSPGRREGARFWIMSDLIVDRHPGFRLPDPLPEFDVLLVAGGVAIGLEPALRWLAQALDGRQGDRPVMMVAGSAELWSETPMVEAVARGRELARELGIHLLADETVRVGPPAGGGTIVVGATLWTDWCLEGRFEGRLARVAARHSWADCKRVLLRRGRPWTPIDALGAHARSRGYIEDALTSIVCQSLGVARGPGTLVPDVRPGDRAVVLTHFAPSRRSLPEDWPGWLGDAWLAASHASDLEDVMHAWGAPALWVHGRAVASADYRIGRTRVVANPLRRWKTAATFNPALVIEA
ncbi:metallophosphoesterase [Methylorubrum populi]|uniref:Metallophosphoesterase n=2 Tax=Hyphomicrobiales TaxID=356 RepID=A0ABU7TGK8_9HYPH